MHGLLTKNYTYVSLSGLHIHVERELTLAFVSTAAPSLRLLFFPSSFATIALAGQSEVTHLYPAILNFPLISTDLFPHTNIQISFTLSGHIFTRRASMHSVRDLNMALQRSPSL